MPRLSLILTAGCTLILSACGGGGGNPGTSATGTQGTTPAAPVTQTAQPTAITPANAANAGGNGYAASALVSQTSSSVANILAGVSVAPGSVSAVTPVLDLVKHTYAQSAPNLLAGVTQSETCAGGGTLTVDANLRNAQTISNGDTITITTKNCALNGIVLNGGFAVSLSNVSGDIVNSTSGSATLDTRFTNFSVGTGTGGGTAALSGDMKIAVNASSSGSLSLTISGSSLQGNEQRSGGSVTRTMTNYAVTGTQQGSSVSTAASFTMAGTSAALGQFSYTVKNLKPFVTAGTVNPTSGALVVNGAGSSVTVTVLDAANVKLEYSAKGDGVVTDTRTLTWSEFLAAY